MLGVPHAGPGGIQGYDAISHVSGPVSDATPTVLTMTHDVAERTSAIWNLPLLPGCAEPETVMMLPTSPATRPERPVIVTKGALTGVPDVLGTHTPPTSCPGSVKLPPPAVEVAPLAPEACGGSRYWNTTSQHHHGCSKSFHSKFSGTVESNGSAPMGSL